MKEPSGPPENDTNDEREARTYEGWSSVFEASTDFEADLVRDRLDESGVAAVVLTQRDHSFNLNVGDLAPVHVMVPPADEVRAREVLAEAPISDEELDAAALAADVSAPDAHSFEDEAALDSGIDSINLSISDDEEE